MSKKKAAVKKPARRSRSVKSSRGTRKPTTAAAKRVPPAVNIYVYRHEVENNPNNAPLIVDIPIAVGRGKHPARPSFVGFTAEMNDDQWPDQFAFRVVSLDNTSVRVMVSRIDKGSSDMSWGAKLVVHVLVVTDEIR